MSGQDATAGRRTSITSTRGWPPALRAASSPSLGLSSWHNRRAPSKQCAYPSDPDRSAIGAGHRYECSDAPLRARVRLFVLPVFRDDRRACDTNSRERPDGDPDRGRDEQQGDEEATAASAHMAPKDPIYPPCAHQPGCQQVSGDVADRPASSEQTRRGGAEPLGCVALTQDQPFVIFSKRKMTAPVERAVRERIFRDRSVFVARSSTVISAEGSMRRAAPPL